MMEEVYDLTFSCYNAALDFYMILLNYGATFMSWRKVLYNLVHNFGRLYDDGVFAFKFFTDIRTNRADWWRKVGKVLGDIMF